MGKTVLCADSESMAMPELIGIDEASLEGLAWLECYSDAGMARQRCRQRDVGEAWIVGTDDFTSLNLAAALRSDDPSIAITIVESNPTGSFLSRAAQASVTRVISADEFRVAFYAEVRRRALMNEVASIDIELPKEGDPMPVANGAKTCNVEPPHPSSGAICHPAGPEEMGPNHDEVPGSAHDRLSRGDGFVLSVFGGSGGVGKSSFCAMAAYATAAKGFRTVIVDLDLQFGDIAALCSDAISIPIEKVVQDPGCIGGLSSSSADEITVIASPEGIEDSEKLSPEIPKLLSYCASAFDVVVVNTQCNWNEAAVSVLERSTCPVFVMDQRSSSVRACIRITELCLRMGVATGSFVYALNGCSKRAMFSAIDVANAMQGVQVFELCDGSLEVEEMLGAGGASDLYRSGNPFAQSVERMLAEIMPARGVVGNGLSKGGRSSQRRSKATASSDKGAKATALERRSHRLKKKREKRTAESEDESLLEALFGTSNRAERYIADEMRASR